MRVLASSPSMLCAWRNLLNGGSESLYRKQVAKGSRLRPFQSLSAPSRYLHECSYPMTRRLACGFHESLLIAL